jgi:hypothetical protein
VQRNKQLARNTCRYPSRDRRSTGYRRILLVRTQPSDASARRRFTPLANSQCRINIIFASRSWEQRQLSMSARAHPAIVALYASLHYKMLAIILYVRSRWVATCPRISQQVSAREVMETIPSRLAECVLLADKLQPMASSCTQQTGAEEQQSVHVQPGSCRVVPEVRAHRSSSSSTRAPGHRMGRCLRFHGDE